ncbi:PLD nuclease N-terminal domain-containing protein [Microbacterium sp. NIBRBAC000506063]|uniref:PLD nuclease N-terminal domain-containing protein n=1 Tax=Microbacterium sp. NIBRBAC000506063 TaxID=2734618 RepID=UPI001CB74856|nr:PLD nuclease N-terminal domain-containing protein [Microbacterium sp. NIBRBAC000506063]
MHIVLSLLTIALMVFALIDIITRRDDQVKYLPKMVWLILVILLPFIGSVLWFAIGREYEGQGSAFPAGRRPLRIRRARRRTGRPRHRQTPAAPSSSWPTSSARSRRRGCGRRSRGASTSAGSPARPDRRRDMLGAWHRMRAGGPFSAAAAVSSGGG